MQAYVEVPDLVWFDQVQITDIPEQVLEHLWLDHTSPSLVIIIIITTS